MLAAAFYFIFLLAIYFLKIFTHQKFDSPEQWGVMGDFFGGNSAAVFGFASFMALLFSLKKQYAQYSEDKYFKNLELFQSAFYPFLRQNFSTLRTLKYKYKSDDPTKVYHGKDLFALLDILLCKIEEVNKEDLDICIPKDAYLKALKTDVEHILDILEKYFEDLLFLARFMKGWELKLPENELLYYNRFVIRHLPEGSFKIFYFLFSEQGVKAYDKIILYFFEKSPAYKEEIVEEALKLIENYKLI